MPIGDELFLILLLALIIDVALGEYPRVLHPVVWFGQAVLLLLKLAPRAGWWRQLLFGTLMALGMIAVSVALAIGVMQMSADVPLLNVIVGVYLLKASFAMRELDAAAGRVEQPLAQGDLDGARSALRSLCSRNPTDLDASEILGGSIESLAENASDSFVAPLFYFVLFGVPGAVGYRAINTLDAMIGYRGEYEALGKAAARIDDVANWIPARLTACLLLLSGWLLRLDVANGWRILRRDAAKTPSPNAGRPMAVMAGLLHVELMKKGVYVLGEPTEQLSIEKLRLARGVTQLTALLAALGSALMVALTH